MPVFAKTPRPQDHFTSMAVLVALTLAIAVQARAGSTTTTLAHVFNGTQSMKQDWFIGGMTVWGGGANTQNVYGCALKFDLSRLTVDTVTNATLVLEASGAAQGISVSRFTADPAATGKYWSTGKAGVTSFAVSTSPQTCSIDLTTLVQGWLDGTYPNYGLWFYGNRYSGVSTSFDALTYDASTHPAGPHLVVAQQTGGELVPQLQATPGSGGALDFGHLAVSTGALYAGGVTLANVGDAGSAIQVTAADFAGPAASLFAIDGGFAPADLDPAGTGSVHYGLKFLGTSTPGSYDATVTFANDSLEGNVSYTLHAVVDAPVSHPGDVNRDGLVNLEDFGLLKGNFGATTGATWEMGDLNADGGINLEDFGILKDHFGHTAGSSPITAIPEPATIVLLAAGAFGMLKRMRKH